MDILASYINRHARNKLLFTSHEIKDINYVDIGRRLSEKLENSLQKRHLPMIAEDALKEILSQNSNSSEAIGKYIAIKNIGILFEPILRLDLKTILSNWSRDYILIVYHEGEIRNDIFYLAPHVSKYSVNLKEITYKAI